MIRFLSVSLFSITFILSKEVSIKSIELSGPITDRKQEISGMDWYNDNLFFLPENQGGFLFMITKSEIQNNLQKDDQKPIVARQTKFSTPDYSKLIPGFDGFEAICFSNENVYISIESEHNDIMSGHIAWGTIDKKTFEINIPPKNIKKVKTPIQISNMSFESILMHNDHALMLYEANGANLQRGAYHILFSPKDQNISRIRSVNIEYRITDATKVDENNKFWSINYFWPGDKKALEPSRDLIFENTPKGDSHQSSNIVERLIEFEIKNKRIILTKSEPIQLVLNEDSPSNWESIVRFDNKGFLIATDKHPRMILSFVPFN